jgi:hypothetical protein
VGTHYEGLQKTQLQDDGYAAAGCTALSSSLRACRLYITACCCILRDVCGAWQLFQMMQVCATTLLLLLSLYIFAPCRQQRQAKDSEDDDDSDDDDDDGDFWLSPRMACRLHFAGCLYVDDWCRGLIQTWCLLTCLA